VDQQSEILFVKHLLGMVSMQGRQGATFMRSYQTFSQHEQNAKMVIRVANGLFLQRRNLRILYDAIGTLADAVGNELNNVCIFNFSGIWCNIGLACCLRFKLMQMRFRVDNCI
jgi:hypothetical protein